MVWMFERGPESFELETRYDNDAAEFVLIIHWPNGNPQIERFAQASEFRNRLAVLEQRLDADNWVQHGPMLLHEGWKL
jgi:hypothetical protein